MSKPIIRGISITIMSKSLFDWNSSWDFEAILDEKPLGRAMEPAYQRAIIIKGNFELPHYANLAEEITHSIRSSAQLHPVAGVRVKAKPRSWFARRAPEGVLDQLHIMLAASLTTLPKAA